MYNTCNKDLYNDCETVGNRVHKNVQVLGFGIQYV